MAQVTTGYNGNFRQMYKNLDGIKSVKLWQIGRKVAGCQFGW